MKNLIFLLLILLQFNCLAEDAPVDSESVVLESKEENKNYTNKLIIGGLILTPLLMVTLDEEMKEFAQRNRYSSLEDVIKIARPLGKGGYTVPGLGIAYLSSALLKQDYFAQTTALAFKAWFYTGAVVTLVKQTFRRSRPYRNEGIFDFNGPSFELGDNSILSFPSGDSGNAWSIATVYAYRYQKKLPWLPYVLYPAAAAVSYGRMHDNKHFLSDVFMGGVIGYLFGYNIAQNDSFYFYPISDHSKKGLRFAYSF